MHGVFISNQSDIRQMWIRSEIIRSDTKSKSVGLWFAPSSCVRDSPPHSPAPDPVSFIHPVVFSGDETY